MRICYTLSLAAFCYSGLSMWSRVYGPLILKYLPAGSLQNKFANSWARPLSISLVSENKAVWGVMY